MPNVFPFILELNFNGANFFNDFALGLLFIAVTVLTFVSLSFFLLAYYSYKKNPYYPPNLFHTIFSIAVGVSLILLAVSMIFGYLNQPTYAKIALRIIGFISVPSLLLLLLSAIWVIKGSEFITDRPWLLLVFLFTIILAMTTTLLITSEGFLDAIKIINLNATYQIYFIIFSLPLSFFAIIYWSISIFGVSFIFYQSVKQLKGNTRIKFIRFSKAYFLHGVGAIFIILSYSELIGDIFILRSTTLILGLIILLISGIRLVNVLPSMQEWFLEEVQRQLLLEKHSAKLGDVDIEKYDENTQRWLLSISPLLKKVIDQKKMEEIRNQPQKVRQYKQLIVKTILSYEKNAPPHTTTTTITDSEEEE